MRGEQKLLLADDLHMNVICIVTGLELPVFRQGRWQMPAVDLKTDRTPVTARGQSLIPGNVIRVKVRRSDAANERGLQQRLLIVAKAGELLERAQHGEASRRIHNALYHPHIPVVHGTAAGAVDTAKADNNWKWLTHGSSFGEGKDTQSMRGPRRLLYLKRHIIYVLRPRNIMPAAVIVLYPEALASSATLPVEILHAASQMSRSNRGRGIASSSRFLGLSDDSSVALDSGLRLSIDAHFSMLEQCDLLILPAIWRHPRRVLSRFTPWYQRLRDLYAGGTTICSVGTASAILAEAGLLDGRPATTHWHDFERFAAAYPRVDLKRRHLITQSERLYCAGSVNSIADFMVHQVEQWYGERIARAVEAQFSPEARQSFENAAFLQQSPGAHHDALIREAQDLMQQCPAEPHSLQRLAKGAGLSTRSFGRRFRRATGETPMHYLLKLRVREAKALLQHSDLNLSEIAWRSGFNSPSRFSQAFRALTDMSPRDYRDAVRGKRFTDIGP
jgi:transcriptional regulator GlxA family with amidase domain